MVALSEGKAERDRRALHTGDQSSAAATERMVRQLLAALAMVPA
jgi:hypothetical protein